MSRVVNKESGVSPRTREKVEAIIAKLDYQPNPSARGLASSRSFLIALLYDNPSTAYIISLQTGALGAYHVGPVVIADVERYSGAGTDPLQSSGKDA